MIDNDWKLSLDEAMNAGGNAGGGPGGGEKEPAACKTPEAALSWSWPQGPETPEILNLLSMVTQLGQRWCIPFSVPGLKCV